MNKFCYNCGQKLNENDAFCSKCGIKVNNSNLNNKKQEGKGTGIASMVLGIIATWYSISALFIFVCLLAAGEYLLIYEKFAFAIIFLIVPITLFIIGLVLGIVSRNKIKNGINLTGVILNIISFILCFISIEILCII